MIRISALHHIYTANIVPAFLVAVLLVFVLFNPMFSKRQKHLFTVAILVTLFAQLAISIDAFLSYAKYPGTHWMRRVTSFFNFALSPVIPYLLLHIFKDKKLNFYYSLPLIINTIICFISMFVKVVYFISVDNLYERGAMFFLPILTCLIYIALLMLRKRGEFSRGKKGEQAFLAGAIGLLAIGMTMEIGFHYRFVTWGIAAVIFVMYYLLLVINGMIIDSLTGIYNRVCYDKNLLRVNKKCDCTLVMMDINGFKEINDTLGHDVGDRFLENFAILLEKNMAGVAIPYRIGGDEFFCIAKKRKMSEVEKALERLTVDCASKEISFAYGICEYKSDVDIYEAVKEADALMYKHKQDAKIVTE